MRLRNKKEAQRIGPEMKRVETAAGCVVINVAETAIMCRIISSLGCLMLMTVAASAAEAPYVPFSTRAGFSQHQEFSQ